MMQKSSCHLQLVKWYASFLEMIEAEGLTHVLPGVKTIEEGSNSIKIFPLRLHANILFEYRLRNLWGT